MNPLILKSPASLDFRKDLLCMSNQDLVSTISAQLPVGLAHLCLWNDFSVERNAICTTAERKISTESDWELVGRLGYTVGDNGVIA